ncbi:tyrosine-type recombinase/integrase [Pseudomonas sp. JDS28PS106]|uniref:tyrosine-type recombinase/integrase n=1 Tax=Pseudomonas sp. JDS28PS106 TaxID=2497235 RepID=UPI002FD757E0
MSNVKYEVKKDVYLGRNSFKCVWKISTGAWVRSQAFDVFMWYVVLLGRKFNSLRSYSYKVASFLDYLYVGLQLCDVVDRHSYILLARYYHAYLTQGLNSLSPMVQAIARRRPSPMLSVKTSKVHHAAVQQLIKACNEYGADSSALPGNNAPDEEVRHLGELRLVGLPRSEQELKVLDKVYGRQANKPSQSERMRIFAHLPKTPRNDDPYEIEKAFPLDRIGELINSATSHRDAALWALIAATSLRASEALQVLWCDINFRKRQIYAVNPTERQDADRAYQGISVSQRDKLAWKGRTTKYTLLLEPYGDMFFEQLELYLKYEYQGGSLHEFVFQSQDGYPLCFCDYGSVVVEPFARAAEKVLGVRSDPYQLKLHSLRHSYCFYMKNFVEHTDGIGLTDYEIMALTGHADVASVARYAIVSLKLLNEKLAVAFRDFKSNKNRSLNEMLLGFHERRIVALKREIAKEQETVA